MHTDTAVSSSMIADVNTVFCDYYHAMLSMNSDLFDNSNSNDSDDDMLL